MHILKKTTLGVVVSLLVSALFVFGLSYGLLKILGSADPIKSALKDSGIYQSVVNDALEQVQKEQQNKPQPEDEKQQIPLDRPEIQNIIKSAASPELLQNKTESALDSVYAWLRGDTPTLAFTLETDDIKTNLANGVEQYVSQHVTSLPACGPGAGNNIDDPFNATCRPQGLDPKEVAAQAKNELLQGEFLKDTTINADDIKGKDGQTVAQQLKEAPNIYKNVSLAVYGIGVLALLLAAGVVFLSATWRSGLKKVSIIFIVIGSISILLSWLAGLGMERAAEAAKEPLQQSGVRVAEALAGDLRSWWLWYGIGLAVIGIATLVVLRITRPTAAAEAQKSAAEPTGESLPAEHTADEKPAEPVSKPKARPVKKLVQ